MMKSPPEVLQHPGPVAVLVHGGRVVPGLAARQQRPEGDRAHADSSHRPHARGAEGGGAGGGVQTRPRPQCGQGWGGAAVSCS